jgi:hypothetical protein
MLRTLKKCLFGGAFMKKIYCKSIPDFMREGFVLETITDKIKKHFKQNKSFYIRASGFSILFLWVGHHAFAASPENVDRAAHEIYRRLCKIGKWIIVIRGAIDVIGNMTNGDLENMKKKIIGYVLGYIALLGLPWLLDQAGGLFESQPTDAQVQPRK